MEQLKPGDSVSEARPASSSKPPVTAPGQQQLPLRPQQRWHTSVWEVWDDPPSSVMGVACPCCLLADNVSRLDGRCAAGALGYVCSCYSCFLTAAALVRLPPFVIPHNRYGVPWCTGCAWALLFPLLSCARESGATSLW